MHTTDEINKLLDKALPIALAEMDSVALQNRIDKKYMLHIAQLPGILAPIIENYYVLEINSNRVFSYKTTYFDTPDLQFYKDHHNGLSNRIKVRCRQYVESGSSYFEIKKKSQGYRTDKYRKTIDSVPAGLGNDEYNAVRARYDKHEIDRLDVTLHNFFYRVTLVNKKMTERVTIDFGLQFSSCKKEAQVDDIAIIEVKQGKYDDLSPVVQSLKRQHIFPHSISKYVYGLLLTGNNVKHNAFKQILQKVNKIQHSNGTH